jgi:hypothetical protein
MKIYLLILLVSSSPLWASSWQERFKSYADEQKLLSPIADCQAVSGEAIGHFEKKGENPGGKKILVLSLMHGNELPAGDIALRWIKRLHRISPSNSWYVIPVVNPDGVKKGTRTNANGVDLNRHFPTRDWELEAIKAWKSHGAAPQKYPGEKPGVEPELVCVMKVIKSFDPDLIVSLHTPFGLLDYDGPGVEPRYLPLKWKRLGHYPGSLGRYAWAERKIPVITVELPASLPVGLPQKMDRFQDELSYLAR